MGRSREPERRRISGVLNGSSMRGGIHSPLIAWGPGVVNMSQTGKRNTESVFSAIDLVPSLVRLGGAQKPAGASYDGEDLLDTLLGNDKASRKEPIFFARPVGFKEMPMPGFVEQLPDLAIRVGKWKILCDYDGSRPELYDLSNDPGEKDEPGGFTFGNRQEADGTTHRLASGDAGWPQEVSTNEGTNINEKLDLDDSGRHDFACWLPAGRATK